MNTNNVGKIRIIDSEKIDVEAIFLPGEIKNSIPSEAYNNFLMNLSNENVKIYIPDKEDEKIKALINNVLKGNKDVIIIAHSTSSRKAINIANHNNIKNVILIDPIDIKSINIEEKINFIKGESFNKIKEISQEIYDKMPIRLEMKNKKDKNEYQIVLNNENNENNEISNINNILLLKSKLSDKWKYIPFIPPIGLYSLDPGNYNFENTNITIKEFDSYGHFDIIDSPWSDILHKTISPGYKDRENFKIQSHQKLIAQIVSGYAKKKK
tara:strand:- start:426 stop:1229 length:804 start_codon:yes stop_codon:yes gene_type:complete